MVIKHENRPSHVYQKNGKYLVCQMVNGKLKTYGTFHDLNEAISLRNKLVEDGVIKSRAGLHRLRGDMRYITKYGNKYCIYKSIDGKQEYFGRFKSIEEAKSERNFLESIDWDYGNMETVESLEYQENKEKWRRAINE